MATQNTQRGNLDMDNFDKNTNTNSNAFFEQNSENHLDGTLDNQANQTIDHLFDVARNHSDNLVSNEQILDLVSSNAEGTFLKYKFLHTKGIYKMTLLASSAAAAFIIAMNMSNVQPSNTSDNRIENQNKNTQVYNQVYTQAQDSRVLNSKVQETQVNDSKNATINQNLVFKSSSNATNNTSNWASNSNNGKKDDQSAQSTNAIDFAQLSDSYSNPYSTENNDRTSKKDNSLTRCMKSINISEDEFDKLGLSMNDADVLSFNVSKDEKKPLMVQISNDVMSLNLDGKNSTKTTEILPKFISNHKGKTIFSLLKTDGAFGNGLAMNYSNTLQINLDSNSKNGKLGVIPNSGNMSFNKSMFLSYMDTSGLKQLCKPSKKENEASQTNDFVINNKEIVVKPYSQMLSEEDNINKNDQSIKKNIVKNNIRIRSNSNAKIVSNVEVININDNDNALTRNNIHIENLQNGYFANDLKLDTADKYTIIDVNTDLDNIRMDTILHECKIQIPDIDKLISNQKNMQVFTFDNMPNMDSVSVVYRKVKSIISHNDSIKTVNFNNIVETRIDNKIPDIDADYKVIETSKIMPMQLPNNDVLMNLHTPEEQFNISIKVNQLVPVTVLNKKKEVKYVLWYEATNELAEKLPSEYKSSLLNEIESLKNTSACSMVKKEATQDFVTDIWRGCSDDIKDMKIFPNPAKEKFETKFTLVKDGMIDIDLHDITGRKVSSLVQNLQLKSGEYTLPVELRNVNPGMYYVVLRMENGSESMQRLIVE